MQFVVLPVVFLLAAAIADVRVVKRLGSLVLFALPLVGALALGPMRVLGYYSRIANLDVHPLEMAGWGATDLMLLAYSSGWVLVPGAVVGLAYALWKPRSRDERRSARLPSSSWARSSSRRRSTRRTPPSPPASGRFQGAT